MDIEKPKATPKDFFLWAGAMVALYWSVIAFVNLAFNYIDFTFPNPLMYYPTDPYQSGIGFEMASLIVLTPIFLTLMRFIRRDMEKDPTRADIWVRRWALYLVLFVAGIAMAGDLIVLLNAFFSGEALTVSFFLKIAIVFLVAAVGFMHFIADVWGYWKLFPQRARSVAIALGVLVVFTVGSGFFVVGTPQQARLALFDEQKVQDLQQIQSRVIYIWQQKGTLPGTMSQIADPLSGFTVPTDSQTGAAYEYSTIGAKVFTLCATFNSLGGSSGQVRGQANVQSLMQDSWLHNAGHVCFERTIDAQLYPPLNKQGVPIPPEKTVPVKTL